MCHLDRFRTTNCTWQFQVPVTGIVLSLCVNSFSGLPWCLYTCVQFCHWNILDHNDKWEKTKMIMFKKNIVLERERCEGHTWVITITVFRSSRCCWWNHSGTDICLPEKLYDKCCGAIRTVFTIWHQHRLQVHLVHDLCSLHWHSNAGYRQMQAASGRCLPGVSYAWSCVHTEAIGAR